MVFAREGKARGGGTETGKIYLCIIFVRRGAGKSTKHKCPCRCLESDELRREGV